MDLIKKYRKRVWLLASVMMVALTACTISYKFNGSSINYEKTKTISFENFPNRSAAFVWGPMQTRLKQVRQGGDLELSGEITNYDAINKGIGSDGYSTMAELRMTVNVRFVNNANHAEDFDNRQFSASREYDASQQLSAVQEELVNQMIDEIVEQIFNATVANW